MATPSLTHGARPDHPDSLERALQTADICGKLGRDDLLDTERIALAHRLVEVNAPVARSVAARYQRRGIALEDLEQVALLGLVKAARRFDPSAGHDFLSYAVPTVRGEVRRHFRDAGWAVRPPRRIQELQSHIASARSELDHDLGRTATPEEVARHLDRDLSEVLEALAAVGCFSPATLNAPVGGTGAPLGETIAADGGEHEATEARVVLAPVVRRLSSRDREILRLRFYEDRTQKEIADDLGVTQSQVSRLLDRILTQLRSSLGGALPV